MKRLLPFIICLTGVAFLANAQISFEDDFESYEVGDYIGVVSDNWTTWLGNIGTNEDAQVTDEFAASGEKSLYFPGAAAGPQDVVLPFGDKYESGHFVYSMKMRIEEGTAAYFNLQGEQAIGTIWATQIFFRTTGVLEVEDQSNTVVFSTVYPIGDWFEITYDINLTDNIWRVEIDGACLGSFTNVFNAVASLDLFPLSQEGTNSVFWVDDVKFSHDPEPPVETEVNTDASVLVSGEGFVGLTGKELSRVGTLTNTGNTMIESFNLSVDIAGEATTVSETGLSLAPGGTYEIALDSPLALPEGREILSITIVDVNGSPDDESCNDYTAGAILGITPAPRRAVFVEEATGTWCTWCPRGAVFMELMDDLYEEKFVGIAVHNGDPMVVDTYDSSMSSNSLYDFTGYPSVVIERSSVTDPSTMELPFLQALAVQPRAVFNVGAEIDEERNLDISVEVEAMQQLNFADNLAIFLVENNVTGTTSGYAQVNNYSGGEFGPMGGYEDLPNPVPASDMVYHDVARVMINGYNGTKVGIATTLDAGGTKLQNYKYTIPEEFKLEDLYIVAVLINTSKTADNAIKIKLEDAIANGFNLSNVNDPSLQAGFDVYPNPAGELMNVRLESNLTGDVYVEMFNLYGQLVKTDKLSSFRGSTSWLIDISDLADGMYMTRVRIGNNTAIQKVEKLTR